MVVSQLPASSLEAVRQALVGLKMPRALEALSEIIGRLEQGEMSALEAMEALLTEELHTQIDRIGRDTDRSDRRPGFVSRDCLPDEALAELELHERSLASLEA